jgi:hypothetical protein
MCITQWLVSKGNRNRTLVGILVFPKLVIEKLCIKRCIKIDVHGLCITCVF